MTKIQFNATTGKNFRATMAKYHVARHQLNDTINKLNDALKSWNKIMDGDFDDLDDLKNGNAEGVLRDEATIKSSIATAHANIERIKDTLSKAREKAQASCEKAEALVTDDLYNAYAHDENFADAIATWFKAQGFTDATAENCDAFTRYIGNHSKNNSARQSAKKGYLTDCQNKKGFIKLWLGSLCDDLQKDGVINAYKYQFDVTKKA